MATISPPSTPPPYPERTEAPGAPARPPKPRPVEQEQKKVNEAARKTLELEAPFNKAKGKEEAK